MNGNETESGPVDSEVHTALINFDVSGIVTCTDSFDKLFDVHTLSAQ